jgi:hypothetical protein
MNTNQLAIAAAMTLTLALWQFPDPCLAGGYRSGGTGYRAPGSGTVYGFGSNGKSFVYRQPVGTGTSGQSTRGPAGSGPQYRLDGFTAPPSARTPRPVTTPQPAFFSGRVWYPRGF